MKKSTYFIYSLLAGMLMLATTATAQTWNFNTVSAADKANLAADAADGNMNRRAATTGIRTRPSTQPNRSWPTVPNWSSPAG